MKKPIVYLRTKGDIAKLLICLALCATASLLFFLPEKSVAAFASGDIGGIKGLFSLVNQII